MVISGDADKAVSTDIHSRAVAAAVPHAKLIVLEGIAHMVIAGIGSIGRAP